jgi:hypothetical protein
MATEQNFRAFEAWTHKNRHMLLNDSDKLLRNYFPAERDQNAFLKWSAEQSSMMRGTAVLNPISRADLARTIDNVNYSGWQNVLIQH